MQIGGMSVGYRRSIVLQIIPGNRKAGESFIREAEAHFNAKTKKMVTIYTGDYWGQGWRASNVVPKRPLESVILPPDIKKHIIDDVTKFKNTRERYNRLSIPWRRGYLLYGQPGNGKTSLALAIASEFNYALYTLNLSSVRDDEKLRLLCDCIPENAVLLMEDIDCSTLSREAKKTEDLTGCNVTLSGLLNALDGVTSGEGRIVIMTTNHPDKLDPALIRPGRADCHIAVSSPTPYQAAVMFGRFYGDERLGEEFAQGLDYTRLSMAKLQVYMLSHDTAQEAMNHRWDMILEKESVAV
jgi:chaperone BCS1